MRREVGFCELDAKIGVDGGPLQWVPATFNVK